MTTFAFLLSAPLAAQWLNYKTPGIPRAPDGKPNLSAPAPKSPEGKPDLSGIWRGPMNSPYLRDIAVDLKPSDIQPWAQAVYQQHVFNLGADSPRAHCLPDPPPYYHLAGISRIVQSPAQTGIGQLCGNRHRETDLPPESVHLSIRRLSTIWSPALAGMGV